MNQEKQQEIFDLASIYMNQGMNTAEYVPTLEDLIGSLTEEEKTVFFKYVHDLMKNIVKEFNERKK